ncbi:MULTISPECIES: hypothetical protein [Pseudomonas]|uniref:DUF2188 domain-containing protein n=1 Tax=Pseudomonas fulva TaxID=47880 RepID=A0A0D0KMK3_9PSED|nr:MULTISPECIES: hypothetical protein [Pseudomonas]KIQ00760.1 hypothetical protein RU08_10445 [Pseudomonas fulva]
MTQQDVQIECVDKGDGVRWCVRLGKRTLMFEDELAARTFAAQLHMRVNATKLTLVPGLDEPPGT